MPSQTFTTGRLRRADYDPGTRQLELHFDQGQVLAYAHVPQEVYRRLCSAPNAATYWEDRIAEEYPKARPVSAPPPPAAPKDLRDLFGGDREKGEEP